MHQGVARSADPDISSSTQGTLALLEKTPVLLETLLRDLPEELLRWKPAPERWSVTEVLAHLAEIELLYADRTRRMVTEDTPTLERFDPGSTVVAGDHRRGTGNENLTAFLKARRATLVLLKSIPADSEDRLAMHAELGMITLGQMLNEWACHDLGHLRQIAELYRAHAFYPYAGPFRKYSNPKP